MLNVAIEATNIAKEAWCGTPAQAVFGPVNIILTMIKVSCSFQHSISASHVSRTTWPTTLTTSSSGLPALRYAMPSTRG